MAILAVFARTRLLGAGLLALAFVAGALSGAAIDRALVAEETEAAPTRDGRDRDRRRSYVIHQVEMTPDQRATIDAILDRRTERMRSVWREVEPRMDAITDSARSEIMDALTPEQRERYRQLLDERRARRRSHDAGRRD